MCTMTQESSETTSTTTPETDTSGYGQVTGSGMDRVYTTKEGDTLDDVAAFFYGDPAQKQRILDDNPDITDTGESISPGTRLRVSEDESRGDTVTST
jgi:nucleoid-associated protein YgaU